LYQGRKTSLTTLNTPSSLKRSVSARTTGLQRGSQQQGHGQGCVSRSQGC
jgi:hypothetical protein